MTHNELIAKAIDTIDTFQKTIEFQAEKIEALEETVDLYAQLVEEYTQRVALLTDLLAKATAQARRKKFQKVLDKFSKP